MSIATDSNTATPDPAAPGSAAASSAAGSPAGWPVIAPEIAPEYAVESALAAAIKDAGRVGDLLDVLRRARLWLPLPTGGAAPVQGSAVTLPTVCYLGCDFVPAYSSARLLQQLARRADTPQAAGDLPHAVVRAADLAGLLPPNVGIALNAGASESVPVYPPGVLYLAAQDPAGEPDHISVGPLPVRPDGLLADIAAGFMQIGQVRDASAAWLSVRFAGEGLLISVTLDDPAEAAARDLAAGAIERAAWQAPAQDTAFPIDVTFPGEREPDHIDEWISACATPFYRRG